MVHNPGISKGSLTTRSQMTFGEPAKSTGAGKRNELSWLQGLRDS